MKQPPRTFKSAPREEFNQEDSARKYRQVENGLFVLEDEARRVLDKTLGAVSVVYHVINRFHPYAFPEIPIFPENYVFEIFEDSDFSERTTQLLLNSQEARQ